MAVSLFFHACCHIKRCFSFIFRSRLESLLLALYTVLFYQFIMPKLSYICQRVWGRLTLIYYGAVFVWKTFTVFGFKNGCRCARLVINNPDASVGVCCSHKVVTVGFNTLCYDAERRGIKPSVRIKFMLKAPMVRKLGMNMTVTETRYIPKTLTAMKHGPTTTVKDR